MSIVKVVDFDIECDHCTENKTKTTSLEHAEAGKEPKSVVDVIQQIREIGWKVRHMKGGGIRVKCPACAAKKPEPGDDDAPTPEGTEPAAGTPEPEAGAA